MLTGESRVTLDDMGRVSLPRRWREILGNDNVVLRKHEDGCIWLFAVEEWKKVERDIVNRTTLFSSHDIALRRRYVATFVDIDKQGRILIPPTFREHAGLSKECLCFGQFEYAEIWAEDRYCAYQEATLEQYRAASEEIGARIKKERAWDNGGNSAFAGAAGADAGVSVAEGQP